MVTSIYHAHHISAHILINKLFYHCLGLMLSFRLFDYDVCLHLLVKHVWLWLIAELHFVSLDIIVRDLSGEDIVVDLKSEITVKTLLFFILDRSVHDLLCLELLGVLN